MAVLLFHFCSSGHHFWCACPLKLLLKFMCMEWMGCFNKNDPIVVIGAGLKLALSNSIFGYVDFNNCKDIILTKKTNKLSVGQSSWRSLTLFFPHISNISPIWLITIWRTLPCLFELPRDSSALSGSTVSYEVPPLGYYGEMCEWVHACVFVLNVGTCTKVCTLIKMHKVNLWWGTKILSVTTDTVSCTEDLKYATIPQHWCVNHLLLTHWPKWLSIPLL